MTLKVWVLGAGTKSDRDLYAWVGHWLVDYEVHKALGNAITSLPGDIWIASLPAKGPAHGFALVRPTKSGATLKFLHGDTVMVRKALLARVIGEAKAREITRITGRLRSDDVVLKEGGFTPSDEPKQPAFVTWTLESLP